MAVRSQQTVAERAGAMAAKLLGTAAAAAVLLAGGPALAREKVAEFPTSGLIFRDTVKIIELNDDKVDGVVIYLTDYQRSITERLAKDPFGDPSQASLTCLANRPVTVPDEAAISGVEGKEIFSERKGINLFQNKNLRVRRIYDDKNKVIIYVAYSTRFTGAAEEKELSTSRYRTSVCAVPVSAPSLVPVSEVAAAPEVQE
ncbi:hypothetical protein COHA_000013 [Chlorella ohadii]|uniref:CreA protein n=1 Tax=Chlorella ohadii TaxID=2649997 RepID=A0AAD5E108_9CHLO|nr:hypothetical protein COHA_000013 [Chlorella ohadii]